MEDLHGLNFNLSLTGFDLEEVGDALLADLKDQFPDGGKKKNELELPADQYCVLVECASEKQQVELLEKLHGEGYKCKALIS
jgi:hypothetical protein